MARLSEYGRGRGRRSNKGEGGGQDSWGLRQHWTEGCSQLWATLGLLRPVQGRVSGSHSTSWAGKSTSGSWLLGCAMPSEQNTAHVGCMIGLDFIEMQWGSAFVAEVTDATFRYCYAENLFHNLASTHLETLSFLNESWKIGSAQGPNGYWVTCLELGHNPAKQAIRWTSKFWLS